MINENSTHRLRQASIAWSRLFHNTNPRTQHTTRSTIATTPMTTNNILPQTRTQQNITITPGNLTQNIPWGDEIQDKGIDTIRIYAQNLNGIKIQSDGGQYKEICELAREVQADVVCFQEHNLDTTQFQIRKILHDTTAKQWHRARLTIASSPIAFSGQWKPGGTAILTNGHVTGRITAVGHDDWGRWSYHTIIGQRGRHVTIISAYQVVAQRQALKGLYTTATQQQSLLIRQQDKVTDPRTAFRRDLTVFLKKLRENNHGIILLGDFNERLGEDPAGMSRIATEFHLIDLMRLQHPNLVEIATYARGRKRLDYVLGSAEIANSIENCGYEPFNFRYHTDHRAYFIDLNTKILFGTSIQPLAKFSDRILHSNNIRQVTKYIQIKHKMLTACNAFERGNQLEEPGNRHAFAERLDSDVLRSSLSAEKRLKKYKDPAWSIELAEARKKVSILSKVLSMTKTRIDNIGILQQEMNTLSSPILFPETIRECSTELRNAKREVAAIIQRSFATREAEREKQIAELEAEVTSTKAAKTKIKILRNLKKAEELRKLFLKIKMLRQTKNRSGITRIEVPCDQNEDPKTCTEWKMIDIPTEILHHLQQRNRRHFGQAHGTPFTIPPLSDDLGFTSDTHHGSMILDGTYDATHLDDSVRTIIQHLQRTTYSQLQPLTPTITQSAYLGKITKWRESTSTSPSGLHLGHYKAMTARHEFSDISDKDPRKAEFESQRDDIIKLHLQLLNYGLERGYSFLRWQQVANAMLFKEPGNFKIHRTRVIHLYEADYNLAMGLKWRAAMELSEAGQHLNSGQYGSRPARGAHDPVFIEEFQLEISRASRKTLIQTNYDATSCYDRIIPNLAALVSQKYGVPLPAVMANVKTLQSAQYKLKTELGLSDQGYTHTTEHPIYGTGQGSGNSPMIWCFLSSVLFDCYDQHAHGAIYELPDKSLTTKVHMIGYVDDSNGQTNQFLADQQPTDEQILALAQQDAQTWHDLLLASGGALELPKCVYQVISWTFKSDGSPFMKGYDTTHKVMVHDRSSNTTQEIPGLSAYTAHKTLGHHKDPDGNQNKQRKVLEQKCKQATDFMASSPLTREEAWTYYFSIFQTSVGYPLAASHFKKSILDAIQRQFMSILIAKCGYNRKTKREIIYGPACLGGANFRSLYTIQGTGQVLAFVKYWRSPSQAGKLLRVAVAWTQYAIGMATPFLSDTSTPLPHMESKWLQSLRNYLRHIGGSLQLDCSYIPSLERMHDHHIMEVITQSAKFTPNEIRTLNHCRMYLQAITLSDITNAAGDALDPHMLSGNNDHISSSISTWHHFNQQRPNDEAWDLWREANKLWSTADGKLHQPLTTWLSPPSRQRRTWPVYVDQERYLYARTDNTETPLNRRRYRVRKWHTSLASGQPELLDDSPNAVGLVPYTTEIPDSAIPITVETDPRGKLVLVFTWQMILQQAYQMNGISRGHVQEDFHTYLKNLDGEWEIELLAKVQLTHDAFTTFAKMRKSGFLAAGDGSVRHEHHGAFGWIISTREGERLARANGPVRGYRPTSYRAEGYGILSILRFVKRLLLYCNEDPVWQWEMTSDNISLVDTVNGTEVDEEDSRQRTNENVPQQRYPHDWSVWKEISPHDLEEASPVLWSSSEQSKTHSTLDPDWDVLNEIRWSMSQDGIKGCSLSHIKGHQDRTKKYHKLSLRAQLNVDADALANKYQDEYGQALPNVLMFPHAAVSIQFPHGTCTSHIPAAVRNAENYQPLAQYIRTRNQWSQHQFDSINWAALQYAIKRKNKHRIHITKLIHDVLPTNKILHRHNIPAQRCPTCHTCQHEDRDHVMRCSAPQRGTWRADTIVVLEQRCQQMNTEKGLAELLVHGVSSWLNGHDLGCNASSFPAKYHRLITHQNSIGWRQLFNGRMCSEWSRIQDDHVYNTKLRRQMAPLQNNDGKRRHSQDTHMRSGTQWTGEIIATLWDQWYKVWTMRNSVIHGHDQESRAKHQREIDTQRLHSIYRSRHLMEPSVQELLFPTIEEHQHSRGATAIHNWLSIHETTFIQSVKNVSKRAIKGVRSIKTYFAARKPPATSALGSHQDMADTANQPSRVKRPRTIKSYFVTGRPPERKEPSVSDFAMTVTPSSPARP